jgi:nitric oxide reductase large subunit
MKKDPYYTYTDYWPCKPVVHKVCWVVPVLVLVVVLVLVICSMFLLPWLALLQGG